ncbi:MULTISPECIES: GNAT family N-acetyltransferase [unclassified Streptomyces]|uniref:GNAT family N-acetyltransferase n=1 Tax=unclassified Streptomyces TaxID=2593676 RepID=UPI001CC0B1A9|nr:MULTISPECIES: GNAT family N-acetyltransferase [unclassified Streptomyces]WPO73088.1 GNAT family N-acetyltransferase [Streptomyces sp. KN37]
MSTDPRSSWQLTDDLDGFHARAEEFLSSAPAPHTALLSVTDTLRERGLQAYGEGAPQFGTYADGAGRVRGAFLRTPPHRLLLSPVAPEAADILARQLADSGHALPGVVADRDTAEAFARAWEKHTGATATPGHRQRLYRLAALTPPEPAPPGRARLADDGDRALLERWHGEFAEAVGEPAVMGSGAWVDSRLAHGGVTLWETPDGTPAAMAGVTRRIAGQVRVAPVYTPAALRGRGYGGAATVAVTRAALDAGAAEVLLFTDLANPTSNGLYQRIGYRPVGDFTQYDFSG